MNSIYSTSSSAGSPVSRPAGEISPFDRLRFMLVTFLTPLRHRLVPGASTLGQGTVEYALILSLVAVVAIGAATLFGTNLAHYLGWAVSKF